MIDAKRRDRFQQANQSVLINFVPRQRLTAGAVPVSGMNPAIGTCDKQDGWIRRRIWSHRYRRWRNASWKRLPASRLYGEFELVRLLYLIPSLASWHR